MYHELLEGLTDNNDDKHPYDPEEEIPKQNEFTEESYYKYITMKVIFLMDDVYGNENIFLQKRDCDVKPVVVRNNNP